MLSVSEWLDGWGALPLPLWGEASQRLGGDGSELLFSAVSAQCCSSSLLPLIFSCHSLDVFLVG